MFGLETGEWSDLVRSVNIHRKIRKLQPVEVGRLIAKAKARASSQAIAERLGFRDTTMISKFAALDRVPPALEGLVSWGAENGKVSFSAAAELLRLRVPKLVRQAFVVALEHGLTKEESRQLAQAYLRGQGDLNDCVEGVLRTRPRVERRHILLGVVGVDWREHKTAKERTEILERAVSQAFPDVEFVSVTQSGDRFSLVLDEPNAERLLGKTAEAQLEALVQEALESEF